MFFVGIFGVENKQKEVRFLENLECGFCTELSKARLVKTYKCFHLFFIPIFRWKEQYYVICEECNSLYEIPLIKGKKLEKNEEENISHWDLKAVEHFSEMICPHCKRAIENTFKFCPYCGKQVY